MKKYKNKLIYRSWHRGTREADLFLGGFIDRYITKMSYADMELYEVFLDLLNDNDLLYIVKGEKDWPKEAPLKIIEMLEEFIKSEKV